MRVMRLCLICAAIIAASALMANAQSGRRSGGGSTNTAPSVSGPKGVEKKPQKAPALQLLVAIDDPPLFTNVPYYVADTILDNCLRRLAEAKDVMPSSAGRGVSRNAAIEKAKEEKNRYVVWLQIGSDAVDSGRRSTSGPDELYVSYIILEPETAKSRQSGRAHHSVYKVGRGGVTAPAKNSPLYSEYALKQAARETAEKILEAFNITLRDERWLH